MGEIGAVLLRKQRGVHAEGSLGFGYAAYMYTRVGQAAAADTQAQRHIHSHASG